MFINLIKILTFVVFYFELKLLIVIVCLFLAKIPANKIKKAKQKNEEIIIPIKCCTVVLTKYCDDQSLPDQKVIIYKNTNLPKLQYFKLKKYVCMYERVFYLINM